MAYIYDLTDTWNAGGTTFYGIKMNVTNTASAAGSKLLSLQVGGSEQFGVDKNGNVGIGTSSPAAKLQVETGATTGTALIVGAASATSSQINMGIGVVTTGRPFIGTNTNTNPLEIGTRNASALVLLTDTTERMRITSAGDVGVGTSSPGTKLDVHGATASVPTIGRVFHNVSGNASDYGALQVASLSGPTGSFTSWASGSARAGQLWVQTTNNFPLVFGTNDAERMRIDSSGNVGIGTSSPTAKLDVRGNFNNIWTTGVASTTLIGAIGGISNGYEISKDASDNITHHWRKGDNTNAMLLDTNGNLGIGTSSPISYANYGNLTVAGTNGGTFTLRNTANTNSAEMAATSSDAYLKTVNAAPLWFGTNNTERMRITSAGNLQLGTASLATTATDGFPYIPTCAGTPTGTPTAITGYAPMVVDSTNNKLYVYVGGAWQAMN